MLYSTELRGRVASAHYTCAGRSRLLFHVLLFHVLLEGIRVQCFFSGGYPDEVKTYFPGFFFDLFRESHVFLFDLSQFCRLR